MWYKGNNRMLTLRLMSDRMVTDGLFKETAFRMTLEAKVGVNHLNSQEKSAAERENDLCRGPEEGGH